MESGKRPVYEETVYQPKDTKERAIKKRRLIIIAIVILVVLIVVIIGVAVGVSVSKSGVSKALFHFPYLNGRPINAEPGDRESFKSSMESIKTMLSGYENDKQIGENVLDCSYISTLPPSKVCRFDIENLGNWCTSANDYGFYEGQPCFILQLKPPKDWQPQLSTNATHVPVQCKPSMYQMRDSIGIIEMYPTSGFSRWFFPYTGQEDYMPPLVALRFSRPVPGSLIMVTCSVLDPLLDESNNAAFTTEFAFQMD